MYYAHYIRSSIGLTADLNKKLNLSGTSTWLDFLAGWACLFG